MELHQGIVCLMSQETAQNGNHSRSHRLSLATSNSLERQHQRQYSRSSPVGLSDVRGDVEGDDLEDDDGDAADTCGRSSRSSYVNDSEQGSRNGGGLVVSSSSSSTSCSSFSSASSTAEFFDANNTHYFSGRLKFDIQTEVNKNINPTEFKRRRGVITQWFNEFDDEQKNLLLKELLVNYHFHFSRILVVCNTSHGFFRFSRNDAGLLRTTVSQLPWPPECISAVRQIVATCYHGCHHLLANIFCPFWIQVTCTGTSCLTNLGSYALWQKKKYTNSPCVLSLSLVSLCRCLQVCRAWQALASNESLWQNFCNSSSQWQLSPAAERKQLSMYKKKDGSIQVLNTSLYVGLNGTLTQRWWIHSSGRLCSPNAFVSAEIGCEDTVMSEHFRAILKVGLFLDLS